MDIPSIVSIQEALRPLTLKQLDRLQELSGVPATTIYKIKRAETENPGIETVRKIVPHISTVLAESAAPQAAPDSAPGALDQAEAGAA